MRNRRINRQTFISTFVAGIVTLLVIGLVSNVANGSHGALQNTLYAIFTILLLIVGLYFFIAWIAVTIGRLHDFGWTGVLVILFGLFWPLLIILAFIPGQSGNNQYGEPPSDKFSLRKAFIWW